MPVHARDRNKEDSSVGKKKSSSGYYNEDDVIEGERDGKKGYKYGSKGFVFTGPDAKKKALEQGKEMMKKESKES
jgi:hypothetical protein